MDARTQIYSLIDAERRRQEEKHAGRTCASRTIGIGQKLAILTEEVGEVAKEVCQGLAGPELNRDHLREELVQVAAVAVAWLETLQLAESVSDVVPAAGLSAQDGADAFAFAFQSLRRGVPEAGAMTQTTNVLVDLRPNIDQAVVTILEWSVVYHLRLCCIPHLAQQIAAIAPAHQLVVHVDKACAATLPETLATMGIKVRPLIFRQGASGLCRRSRGGAV